MDAPRQVRVAGAGWLVAGVAQTVLAFLLVVAAARPPQVVAADAGPEIFSSERALGTLARLLGPGSPALPHPVGSSANRAVRERLLAELEQLGLETQVQRRMVCNPEGACAEVENVLGRLPAREAVGGAGEGPRPGILLVAHYDSVPAGPGAGDDLSGVACLLEVLRALGAAHVQPRGPLLVLFSDGEELGLLGARAFVDHHPWMDEVGVVLNLEARGSSGGSILFETGADNAWLVELYARVAPRPTATSYSVELYRLMPNDTDFTPFREAGRAGANFAFIEGVHDYHTVNDTVERLDPRSLQHHGENVLPLVAALAELDLSDPPSGDLVYSDLFSRAVFSWRAGWCLPLLLVEFALFGVCLWRARRSAGWRRSAATGLRSFGAWLLVALAGHALGVVLGLGGGPVGALHPVPAWIAYAASTLLLVVVLGGRARSVLGTLHGLALVWLSGAALTTFFAPGASHLFSLPLVPLLLGLALSPAARGGARSCALLALVVGACTTVLWSPLLHGLAQAFGLGAGAPVAATMAAASPWLAVLAAAVARSARRAVAAALGLSLLLSLAGAMLLPRADASVPGHATFHHMVHRDRGRALVLTAGPRGGLPSALRAEFGEPAPPFLDGRFGERAAPARMLEDEPPTLEIVAVEPFGEGRRVLAILRSPASADRTWLAFGDPAVVRVRAAAGVAAPEDAPVVRANPMVFARVPPEGLELEIQLPAASPVAVEVLDQHLRSSPRILELRRACGPARVPRRSGDTILVCASFSL